MTKDLIFMLAERVGRLDEEIKFNRQVLMKLKNDVRKIQEKLDEFKNNAS